MKTKLILIFLLFVILQFDSNKAYISPLDYESNDIMDIIHYVPFQSQSPRCFSRCWQENHNNSGNLNSCNEICYLINYVVWKEKDNPTVTNFHSARDRNQTKQQDIVVKALDNDDDTCKMWSDLPANMDKFERAVENYKCLIPDDMLGLSPIEDRDESDMIAYWKRYSTCNCEGASYWAQLALNVTDYGGKVTIEKVCETLDEKKAPITKDECKKFNNKLYGVLINMSLEITAEDTICTLLSGDCNSNLEPLKTDPVNCTYCRLFHKKAYQIANRFLDLFDAFYMLCDRVSSRADKDECKDHIKDSVEALNTMLSLNFFKESVIKRICAGVYKCKE